MSTVTIIIAYSNGAVRERSVPKGEAFRILGRENSRTQKIPDTSAPTVTIIGANGRVYEVPSQITIVVPVALPHHIPRPSRQGIFIRDDGQCAYCSKKLHLSNATLDHVIPRSRGGKDTWENLVLACKKCNMKKADRMPAEAGMKLLVQPHVPRFTRGRQ